MLHRGPDDAGSVVVPSTLPDGAPGVAGLGFRRLSILDLTPSGHQPMVDLDTGNCIVFNGEIYNHRALRAELESAGCRFRSTSDTEVLLQALGRWGDRALERIEGMYSFAFSRAADRALMLARDPLGIKPLYVARAGERMLF
ncbi:MAG: asparagine synthetase B, partial [Alphaproteobacteria bacterium]